MKPYLVLALVFCLAACTALPVSQSAPVSPQATLALPSETAPSPTPTPIPPKIKLLAYGYKIKDVGEGWSEGLVRLAFENIADEYIGGEKIDATGITLETQEGKTYLATLYQVQATNIETQVKEIDFSKLPPVIPPHFRWTRFGISGDLVKYTAKAATYDLGIGEYYVRFRPATAAHPTRVVFPKRPDWKIDLSTATQPTLAFPAEASFLTAKPLSALAGRVLVDEPEKLKVTLDGTGGFAAGAQDIQLKYTIVNRDKLDAHSANAELPVRALFFADGAVKLSGLDMTIKSLQAGPGQTKQAVWLLQDLFYDKKCNPKVYALFQESTQYSIYNLNVCK